ncbi:MAG: hypothetical protein HY753_04185, partial [Nitrospirae bacterium]|nr:hypothetical protein [Nitrospirota bacterium]
DKKGKDCYYSFRESQGFGGEVATPSENNNNQVTVYYVNFSGFGLLLDGEGNDVYNAQNLPGSTSPQQPGIGHNFSQGTGWRSNGIGVLVDLKGDDSYIANLSAQGIGFWGGKGILYDQEGNDMYFTLQYGQGASAHGGIGICIDVKGDDNHIVGRSQGLGSGKGSDLYLNPSVGIFLDEQGNDEYNFEGDSCGVGMNDGIGYFLDMSGEDNYKGIGTGKGNLVDHNYLGRKLTLGLFYDNKGADIYSETQPEIMNHSTYSRPAANAPGAQLEESGYQLGVFKDK